MPLNCYLLSLRGVLWRAKIVHARLLLHSVPRHLLYAKPNQNRDTPTVLLPCQSMFVVFRFYWCYERGLALLVD